MSVRSIRSFAVQRSSVSAQTPTCGTTDALQQAQGGSVIQGPVSNNVYFQLLLRENPNSPRFFQRNTTLCRYQIIYPSNDFFFFLYHFLFHHWFCTWRLEICCSFLSHPARCSGWLSKVYNCSVSPCILYDICWVFLPKIQQCRSGSRMQLQHISLARTQTGINSCPDAAGHNKRI